MIVSALLGSGAAVRQDRAFVDCPVHFVGLRAPLGPLVRRDLFTGTMGSVGPMATAVALPLLRAALRVPSSLFPPPFSSRDRGNDRGPAG
jgi:hypothetical protein